MRNLHLLAIILCLPLFAHAQAYKCKQSNGSTSFQDYPCGEGSGSSALKLPPAPVRGASAPGAITRRATPPSYPPGTIVFKDDAEGEKWLAEHNAREREQNKAQRCNYARQYLETLQRQGRVYVRDSKGERVFVSDEQRPALIAAATRQVAQECN